MRFLGWFLGILLLLPGLCSLVVAGGALTQGSYLGGSVLPFTIPGFIIGAIGVAILVSLSKPGR